MKNFSDFYHRTQNFIVRLFVDSSTPLPPENYSSCLQTGTYSRVHH